MYLLIIFWYNPLWISWYKTKWFQWTSNVQTLNFFTTFYFYSNGSKCSWLVWFQTFNSWYFSCINSKKFCYGFNRFMDRDIDALNPRTINRPNVDGRLDATQILIFTILNALGFILVAYFVNDLALALALPILFIIGSYSYFKRFSYLAHIILEFHLLWLQLLELLLLVKLSHFGLFYWVLV